MRVKSVVVAGNFLDTLNMRNIVFEEPMARSLTSGCPRDGVEYFSVTLNVLLRHISTMACLRLILGLFRVCFESVSVVDLCTFPPSLPSSLTPFRSFPQ